MKLSSAWQRDVRRPAYGAAGKTIPPQSPDWLADSIGAYSDALRLIADALAGNSLEVAPGLRLGGRVTKVLSAAAQSIATGRPIELS